MTARAILVAVVLVLSSLHGARAADQPSCEVAGADAERDWQLPSGLLAAIGRIESGRYDPATGRVAAWPFTINAAGEGHYFDSGPAAIEAVQDLVMRGVQLIDVGCFQVDLYYHPDAFTTLEQAFDPHANAEYAARFLSQLHDRTGSWEAAIAWYHSASPAEGEPYRSKVMANWQSGGLGFSTTMPNSANLWAARPSRPTDAVVVLISATALRVRVITADAYAATGAAAGAPTRTVAAAALPARPRSSPSTWSPSAGSGSAWPGSARLPRVITPHG